MILIQVMVKKLLNRLHSKLSVHHHIVPQHTFFAPPQTSQKLVISFSMVSAKATNYIIEMCRKEDKAFWECTLWLECWMSWCWQNLICSTSSTRKSYNDFSAESISYANINIIMVKGGLFQFWYSVFNTMFPPLWLFTFLFLLKIGMHEGLAP